jgi:hypothetical protein
MSTPDIPEEEWSLLANAVAEPVKQLIAVETTGSAQMREVVSRLMKLAGGTRRVLLDEADPCKERPEDVWHRIRDWVSAPSPELPLMIVLMEVWREQEDMEQRQCLAEFWRGMNQLRENWHDLPAQIVFLLSPTAYEHLTLNADHLKRWIALKVRLWKGSTDLAVLARPGNTLKPSQRLLHDSDGFLIGVPISVEESRRKHLHLLAQQAKEAPLRGEQPAELVRRYYLPLISGYLSLGDKKEATFWRQKIKLAWCLSEHDKWMLSRIDKHLADSSEYCHFDVFLSYNHQDQAIVRELKAALEFFGLSIWLDADIGTLEFWPRAIQAAIQNSDTVAFCIGAAGIEWWQREQMREFRGNQPIIPVLLPGAPEKPDLPPFLHDRAWVDLRTGLTEKGIRQLVWGITGVKP